MNKLLDLRFIIGLFFTVIGALLLLFSLLSSERASAVNTWCGVMFCIFGLLMIFLSFQKDAHDELLKDDRSRPGQ